LIAATFLVLSIKLSNLHLKTQPKQPLGSLPLVIVLPIGSFDLKDRDIVYLYDLNVKMHCSLKAMFVVSSCMDNRYILYNLFGQTPLVQMSFGRLSQHWQNGVGSMNGKFSFILAAKDSLNIHLKRDR
jgi:hypothetical protein